MWDCCWLPTLLLYLVLTFSISALTLQSGRTQEEQWSEGSEITSTTCSVKVVKSAFYLKCHSLSDRVTQPQSVRRNQAAPSRAENEANAKMPKSAVPVMATWDWLKKAVNPLPPPLKVPPYGHPWLQKSMMAVAKMPNLSPQPNVWHHVATPNIFIQFMGTSPHDTHPSAVAR